MLFVCIFSSQVPRGLPYFAVDFGLQGGFAHVIENEQKFPHYFGKVSLCNLAVTTGFFLQLFFWLIETIWSQEFHN